MTRTVPQAAALAAGGSQMAYNIMYNIMYNIKQFKTIRNNLFLYCQILFYIVCNIVYNMKQYALQYEKTCTINWNSRNFSSNITIFIKIFTIYFQYCNIVFNIVILYKYCLKNCASFNNLLLDWITIFNFSRQFLFYIVECFLKLPTIWSTILGCRWFANVWNFECRAVGDAQFWVDIRSAVDPERTSEFVETYLECSSAPKSSDPELASILGEDSRWPRTWREDWCCISWHAQQDGNYGPEFLSRNGQSRTQTNGRGRNYRRWLLNLPGKALSDHLWWCMIRLHSAHAGSGCSCPLRFRRRESRWAELASKRASATRPSPTMSSLVLS